MKWLPLPQAPWALPTEPSSLRLRRRLSENCWLPTSFAIHEGLTALTEICSGASIKRVDTDTAVQVVIPHLPLDVVVSRRSKQGVVAAGPMEDVRAAFAFDDVAPFAPFDKVGSWPAEQVVFARPSENAEGNPGIVAETAPEPIPSAQAQYEVGSPPTVAQIPARPKNERVASPSSAHDVATPEPPDGVVAASSDNDVVAWRPDDEIGAACAHDGRFIGTEAQWGGVRRRSFCEGGSDCAPDEKREQACGRRWVTPRVWRSKEFHAGEDFAMTPCKRLGVAARLSSSALRLRCED